MQVAFTVDVEQDVPPFLESWQGVEKGLPRLLDLLATYEIPTTFFITGETAEKYPELTKSISQFHEIGCHGYKHERFDRLSANEQLMRIKAATEALKKITGRKMYGFRAPNFKTNRETFTILRKLGYKYDSSTTCYHLKSWKNQKIVEIPNTFFSSFLRLPVQITIPVLRFCSKTMPLVVLDYHVWEIIEMKNVRFDCRFATGETAYQRLEKVLQFMKNNNFEFKLMVEVAKDKYQSQSPKK